MPVLANMLIKKKYRDQYMDNEEKLHKEIDLIQACITRMANNSFMIKGWCLTLFVALITFFNLKDLSDILLIGALVAVVFLFAYLDAFYLWQERGCVTESMPKLSTVILSVAKNP